MLLISKFLSITKSLSILINNIESIVSWQIVDLSLVFVLFNLENVRSQVTCVHGNVRINLYAK